MTHQTRERKRPWPDEVGAVLLTLARRAIADELNVTSRAGDAFGTTSGDAFGTTSGDLPADCAGDARHTASGDIAADEPDGVPDRADWLRTPGACFVTLTQDGTLRGCIGTVDAWRPLGLDVRANAVAAAVHDRRFPPLRPEELDRTRIEVSVLSPPEPIDCSDEADALATLRPGVDGVVLACGRRRATFLPQVWQRLPDPATFLTALRRKAGLPPDFWSDDVKLSRYTVTAWEEDER